MGWICPTGYAWARLGHGVACGVDPELAAQSGYIAQTI